MQSVYGIFEMTSEIRDEMQLAGYDFSESLSFMSEFEQPRPVSKTEAHPEYRAKTEIIEISPKDPPAVAETLLKLEEEAQKVSAEIQVGQTITDQRGDRYLVKKILGRGGVGIVYQVLQERNGLECALKVLLPSRFSKRSEKARETDIKRFRNEIKTTASLHNPFILPPTDAVEIEIGGEKVLGVVTEVVEGNSLLREMEKSDTGMPCDRVVEFVGELAVALTSLKEVGLIHRDIKPDNIFLRKTADGKSFAALADFGLVITEDQLRKQKTSGTSDSVKIDALDIESPIDALKTESLKKRVTQQGVAVGTAPYMSPEQMQDYPLSQSSDLYSVGVMMYELISKQFPFNGENVSENFYQKTRVPPLSFEQIGIKDVPVWLEDIVMKLLQPNPENRFSSANELFAALKEGVKKDYPKLFHELPFSMNVGSDKTTS